jgi:hypothetical protein
MQRTIAVANTAGSAPGSTTSAASSAAGEHEDFQLPLEGFKGTPEQIEQQWYDTAECSR